MAEDKLSLDPETMRTLAHDTVEMLLEWLANTEEPPIRRVAPAQLRRRLHRPISHSPESFDEILSELQREVIPFGGHGGHPRYFAFTPFSGTWPGALGDFIASACDMFAGNWLEGSGATQIELEVLGWFKDWIGYPAEASGLLMNGGSAANMTAIACARETMIGPMATDLVVYVSDQSHSSIPRGARVLGFRPEQVRVLPSDPDFRMSVRTLSAAMSSDVRSGRRPFFVAATAGTTSTGAIDPLAELAQFCREHSVWLHVDAAYGGFSVLTERGKKELRGIGHANSVALSPHKWLYQPIECGCLLVREGSMLRRAFEIVPEYLADASASPLEVNFSDLGLSLSRTSHALKVWISLRYFGLDAFTLAIDRSLDLAELARTLIEKSDTLEIAAPPSLGVVCFRRKFEGVTDPQEIERLHAGLIRSLEQSGLAFISSTRLRGEYVMRMCVLNHSTGSQDVEKAIDYLATAEVQPVSAKLPTYNRDPVVAQGWLKAPEIDPQILQGIELFSQLAGTEVQQAAALGRMREFKAGETLIEQWSISRDFFVLLEGDVDINIDGRTVRQLHAGDFFGELAALEWAAGYAYPRLATVVAKTDVRALVFTPGALSELVRNFPKIERRIREVATERMGTTS